MACTSGCATQDHATYGECLKAKAPKVAYANSARGFDFTKEKRWNAEIDKYKQARAEGIQPAGTSMRQVETAMRISDKTGTAFDASKGALHG